MADPGPAPHLIGKKERKLAKIGREQLADIERLKGVVGEEIYDKVLARLTDLLDLDPKALLSAEHADTLAGFLRAEITG